MQYVTKKRLIIAGIALVVLIVVAQVSGIGDEQGPTWAEAAIGDLVMTVDVEGT